MGKGDKKSKRGKISQGSYGKSRTKKRTSVAAILVRVLGDQDELVSRVKVEKKLPAQTNKTENANDEDEQSKGNKKKTED